MSIATVAPLIALEFDDATAETTPQGDVFQRRYGATFKGVWPATASQAVVMASTGFTINAAHPDDDRAFVTSISATSPVKTSVGDVAAIQWTITVNWASAVGNATSGGPLQQPAKISRTTRVEEVVMSETYDGKPILNTAGCPYNPPLIKRKHISKYRISKNVSGFDFHAFDDLMDKTNNATWQGFDAKTLLVLPFDIPEKQHDEASGQDYYPLVIELEHDPDTWIVKLPNLGQYQKVDGKLVRIMDDKGEERSEPSFLDADGKALAYPISTTADLLINEYETIEPTSFGPFSILGTLTFPTT